MERDGEGELGAGEQQRGFGGRSWMRSVIAGCERDGEAELGLRDSTLGSRPRIAAAAAAA